MDISHLVRRISIMKVCFSRPLANKEINFTHIIDEFSFGEYFPKIVNPLDDTMEATEDRIFP
jgi:hypothetical protein